MSTIRKISVGVDFPAKVLHFEVGKEVSLQGNSYVIEMIIPEYNSKSNTLEYKVYINGGFPQATVLWKTISGVPVVIEHSVKFE